MSIRRWIPVLDEDEGLKFVSPDGTKGDFVMYADHEREVATLAAENAKLRELLNEATESAEADLLAVGHQHESQARTYAMRSLRSFIERARAALQPSEERT